MRRWLLESTLKAMTDDELWGLTEWNVHRLTKSKPGSTTRHSAEWILVAIEREQRTRVQRDARRARTLSNLAKMLDDV